MSRRCVERWWWLAGAAVLCLVLPTMAEVPTETGAGTYKIIKAGLDFLDETLSAPGVHFQELRMSPIVRWENGHELPLEVGVMALGEHLAPLLKKIQEFRFAEARLVNRALTASVSAERVEGGPLLVVTLNQALVVGEPTGRPDVDAWNRRLIRVWEALLKVTGFEPLVKERKTVTEPGRETWITNVRLDRDGRLQLTGYALSFKGATALGESLYKTGAVREVFLTALHRSAYEKVPVWRFDLVAVATEP